MVTLVILLLFNLAVADEIVAPNDQSGLERYEEHLTDQRENKCAELPIGETKRVLGPSPMNSTARGAPFYNEMNYSITRTGAKKYKVVIPALFSAGAGNDDPDVMRLRTQTEKDELVDLKMRRLIVGCASSWKNALRDKDGNELELTVPPTRAAAKEISNPTYIGVVASYAVPNASAYNVGINCSKVAHELLHRTGLHDEYFQCVPKEGVFKDAQGRIAPGARIVTAREFDCRPRVTTPTVMGIDQDVLTTSPYLYHLKAVCDCAKQPCSLSAVDANRFPGGISNNGAERCPAGYNYRGIPEGAISANTQTEFTQLTADAKINLAIFSKTKRPEFALRPAQFRHLIYPGCEEKNRAFYRCSRNAYDTSADRGCSLTVQECNKNDSWLD